MERTDIPFSKGIHRSPSVSTEKGDLSELVNLHPNNGELMNIPVPQHNVISVEIESPINVVIPQGAMLMCVHHVNDHDHYVYKIDGALKYISTSKDLVDNSLSDNEATQIDDIDTTSLEQIQPLGKVLTLRFRDKPMCWLRWDGSVYILLHNDISIDVDFSLRGKFEAMQAKPEIKTRYGYNEVTDGTLNTVSSLNIPSGGVYTIYMSDFPKDLNKDGCNVYLRNNSDGILKAVFIAKNLGGTFTFEIAPHTTQLLTYQTSIKSIWPKCYECRLSISGYDAVPTYYNVEIITAVDTDSRKYHVVNDDANYSALVNALEEYYENKCKSNDFVYPFFVRCGFRLYDGSVYYVTAPKLMWPNGQNGPALCGIRSLDTTTEEEFVESLIVTGYACKLYATINKMSPHLPEYKDIIKDFFVAISDRLPLYDFSASWDGTLVRPSDIRSVSEIESKTICNDTIMSLSEASLGCSNMDIKTNFSIAQLDDKQYLTNLLYAANACYIVKSYTLDEIADKVGDIFEVDMKNNILKTLTTENDIIKLSGTSAYTNIIPNVLSAYNGRLVLSDIRYQIASDICQITPYFNSTSAIGDVKMRIIVKLKERGRISYVDSGWIPGTTIPKFIYFPNNSAISADVYWRLTTDNGTTRGYTKKSFELKNDSFGTGAYYYDPEEPNTVVQGASSGIEEEAERIVENANEQFSHENIIYLSDAGNPFVFSLTNTNAVGKGKVLAISTTAKALSSGSSYGQQPMYAFCSDGIYPLSVNDQGELTATNPLSRDVINNPDAITQVDGIILYTTEEGIKQLDGQSVSCISTVMNGYNVDESEFMSDIVSEDNTDGFKVNFKDLVVYDEESIAKMGANCIVVPDYVHSLIHFYPKIVNDGGYRKHYVLNAGNGEWSTVVDIDSDIITAVPSYPYTTIQKSDGTLMQFRDVEQLIDEDGSPVYRYGIVLTRAETFSEPYAYKMLADLRMLYMKRNGSACKITVFVSNDREHWSILRSLHSHSYKWFRFRILTKFTDIDALTALSCMTEIRRNHKLR